MSILIIKLGATGDVVRTTPFLRRLEGPVSWITAEHNLPLLEGIDREVRCVSWENRNRVADTAYDLVINLEDDRESSSFLKQLKFKQLFGAHLNGDDKLTYTSDSRAWFDLSLISTYGREKADRLKLLNRRTYQELIFSGLGLEFKGERYYLPPARATGLQGDVAISSTAGPVWPMKKWAYYDELKKELQATGFKGKRPSKSSLACLSIWPMCKVIVVWFPVTACRCIWHWAAACDAFPFLPVPVRGRYTDTDYKKRSYRLFWKSFSMRAAMTRAQLRRSP